MTEIDFSLTGERLPTDSIYTFAIGKLVNDSQIRQAVEVELARLKAKGQGVEESLARRTLADIAAEKVMFAMPEVLQNFEINFADGNSAVKQVPLLVYELARNLGLHGLEFDDHGQAVSKAELTVKIEEGKIILQTSQEKPVTDEQMAMMEERIKRVGKAQAGEDNIQQIGQQIHQENKNMGGLGMMVFAGVGRYGGRFDLSFAENRPVFRIELPVKK